MKKLHRIVAKNINDVKPQKRGIVLPCLESEVLDWAKAQKRQAWEATVELQSKYLKDPKSFNNKYFKYLRRLFELKLEAVETEAHKAGKTYDGLNRELAEALNIESLRVPEHVSCSSISMYEFCPRKWFYRYALGIKMPKTAALQFGTSIDDALNFFYEEKIKNKKAPPRAAVYGTFYEVFNQDKDQVDWGEVNPIQLEKSGPTVIDAYIDKFDSITQAVDVQTECRVPLDNGGLLLGYIDILEKDSIVDTKTAKKPWNDTGRFAKQYQELQPKAYSLWFMEEFEQIPKEFRYQIVTKETDKDGNPTPRTQLIRMKVKQFELEQFRLRVQRIWNEIQKKLPLGISAFPAQAEVGSDPGMGLGKERPGVLCCHEWCDYSKICEGNGLRVPLKWVKKTRDTPGHHIYKEKDVTTY